MRITVVGSQGQVARALAMRASPALHVTRLGRPDFDLESSVDAERRIAATRPDVIVNAAAYTNVEEAERASATAFRVNDTGARKVAAAAAALKVPLVHLSTEYVFDGTQSHPYSETDTPAPLNVYGFSKLAGERAVSEECDDHAILRTSWIYSPHGRNFVTRILTQADEKPEICVIGDRRGAPTSAAEVARGVEHVARNLVLSGHDGRGRGVFHMTCAGDTTWAGFAAEILALTNEGRVARSVIRPISSGTFSEQARRPTNSRLNNDLLAETHGIRLADWKEALSGTIAQIERPPSRHAA